MKKPNLCLLKVRFTAVFLLMLLVACSGGGSEVDSGNTTDSTNQSTDTPSTDTDSSAATPSLQVVDASVVEGDSGNTSLVFSISLTAAASTDVTVSYTSAAGSATAGIDYISTSGVLTIPAGNTAGEISVVVISDTLVELYETLTLTLSQISVNALLANASGTGSVSVLGVIQDDDGNRGHLNDTGFTLCSFTPCDAAEDATNGRDVTAADDSDGRAGFSFTKLDSSGMPLADQSVDYATTPWDCINDNVTNLVWEVKSDDGSFRDTHWPFFWYNSSGINDGGEAGAAAGTLITSDCFDESRCDTEKYVEDVNAIALCGYTDWRLPTRAEFLSLLDYSRTYSTPSIDTQYFPSINLTTLITAVYWTATTIALDPLFAWEINAETGGHMASEKAGLSRVLLVRSDH